MCLAVPIKIIEINGENAIGMVEGIKKEMNISLLPDAKIGDYVLIHAGLPSKKLMKKKPKMY